MKIEKGKEYKFMYHNIKHSFDGGKTFKHKDIIIRAFLPVDCRHCGDNGIILLKIPKDNKNTRSCENNSLKEYRIVRYMDEIKLKGKYRWRLLDEKECSIKVSDCPKMIDCSLNTHEHPRERNWFIYENCGFTEQEYIKVNWEEWCNYDDMHTLGDVNLYYKLIVLSTIEEIRDLGLEVKTYEDWKDIINSQYNYNSYFKMNSELLNEYHISYLRDILKIWD